MTDDTFQKACRDADQKKKADEQATNNANGKRADDADDADGNKRPKQADVLIELANGVELFRTADREAFADIVVDNHRETHRVRGQAFRQWLRFRYFEKTRAGVNSDALAFCRLATGGGTGKRKLYTDDDEILFAGRRPICLNGIEALAGVMWDVTSDYDVPLMVSRGMPSITFLHGSALAIRAAAQRGKDAYIYQFGDHDPSGVLIPRSLERRLNEMCEKLDCPPPTVERRALTEKQIQQHRLPTRPTKRDGNRHAHGFEGDSVELDALPPRVLRSMVRDVIERHISPEATEVLRAAEDSERELLRAWRRTPKKA